MTKCNSVDWFPRFIVLVFSVRAARDGEDGLGEVRRLTEEDPGCLLLFLEQSLVRLGPVLAADVASIDCIHLEVVILFQLVRDPLEVRFMDLSVYIYLCAKEFVFGLQTGNLSWHLFTLVECHWIATKDVGECGGADESHGITTEELSGSLRGDEEPHQEHGGLVIRGETSHDGL